MSKPINCGASIKVGDTYICRILVTPCSVHFGKECARDESERRIMKAFMQSTKGAKDDI